MDKTKLQIGISETIISTAISGVTFALVSCQPLIIVGTTGPVLLFDEALFQVGQGRRAAREGEERRRMWSGQPLRYSAGLSVTVLMMSGVFRSFMIK